MKMNAAVVTSFDEPPHYQKFEAPQPTTSDELLVDVLAVGLHPRVRTGAAGRHYTSTGTLPMIPGVDGVAQRPDGKRIGTDRRSCADIRRTATGRDAAELTRFETPGWRRAARRGRRRITSQQPDDRSRPGKD